MKITVQKHSLVSIVNFLVQEYPMAGRCSNIAFSYVLKKKKKKVLSPLSLEYLSLHVIKLDLCGTNILPQIYQTSAEMTCTLRFRQLPRCIYTTIHFFCYDGVCSQNGGVNFCQNSVSFLPNLLWKPACPLVSVSMGLGEGPCEEHHCPSVRPARLQGTKTAKEESLLWKFGFLGSID